MPTHSSSGDRRAHAAVVAPLEEIADRPQIVLRGERGGCAGRPRARAPAIRWPPIRPTTTRRGRRDSRARSRRSSSRRRCSPPGTSRTAGPDRARGRRRRSRSTPASARAAHTPSAICASEYDDDDREVGHARLREVVHAPRGLTTLQRLGTTLGPCSSDRVLAAVDALADEAVAFTSELIRIPTVNPPGEDYEDCARFIGDTLADVRVRRRVSRRRGTARAHRTASAHQRRRHAARRGARGPLVHLNGHFDVVPAGDGWTVDPFGGVVRDGRIYGPRRLRHEGGHRRGGVRRRSDPRAPASSCRARSRSAARWTKRAAASPASRGSREHGRIAQGPDRLRDHPRAAQRRSHLHRPSRRLLVRGDDARADRPRQHAVPRRQRDRRTWAGCSSAIRDELHAGAARRDARRCRSCRRARATRRINVNGIEGGQPVDGIQTPCVADRCRAVFDRRFLIEEGFDATKRGDRRAARRASPRRARRPLRRCAT